MRLFDPGLGRDYAHNTKRIINKDGTFNVVRKGIRRQRYQELLQMDGWKFFLNITVVYLLFNILFAIAYLVIGTDSISFGNKDIEQMSPILKALFFSMQTFTTVGFGSIYPNDAIANFVSGMEAMSGWLFFAVATGLVYGRFSKATARILFSNNAIVTPYKGGTAVMFRVVNRRPNVLMEMEAKVMMAMDVDEGEEVLRRYFNLKLEASSIHFFPLSWTLVHPIVEGSPLYGLNKDDLEAKSAEMLILIKGFDDTFSKHVHLRFSYTYDEWVWGAIFKRNYEAMENGEIMLDIDAVHDYEKVEL